MPKRNKTEAAKSKVEAATALSALGGSIGGPLGAGIGAVGGLIIGDRNIVFPLDMIAIPAYQAYLLDSRIPPAFQIYIRAGETLLPTGGNVTDVEESDPSMAFETIESGQASFKGRSRVLTAYQKRYKKAFQQIAPKYKKKDGTWKKNGFSNAVKMAHAKARGMRD